MVKQIQINKMIEEIVAGYQPEKIYLFGSYSKDKQTSDSDIDLLIVKETPKRKIERNREVRRCIKTYPVSGLDVFVYTPNELQQALGQILDIGKEAVFTGRLMYERI